MTTYYSPQSKSWVCGGVKVSEEDSALLREAEYQSILSVTPSITTAWKLRQEELKTKELEPYADLLFDEVLTHARGLHDHSEWVQRFKMQASHATSEKDIQWPIYSYQHVIYMEPLSAMKERESAMTLTELREHREKQTEVRNYIRHRHLKSQLWVTKREWRDDGEVLETEPLPPKDVDLVFRKTNLLKRVAMAFGGPNCYARLRTVVTSTDSERGILCLEKYIDIYYKAEGLTKECVAAKIELLKAEKEREKRVLEEGEAFYVRTFTCKCSDCRRFW